MYCYCMNNPIMYSDESGHSPDSIWKTLLGVVGGVGLAVVMVAAVVASGGTLLVPVLVGASAVSATAACVIFIIDLFN